MDDNLPSRINLKRPRGEDAVEHVRLDKKRRHSEFPVLYRRLPTHADLPTLTKPSSLTRSSEPQDKDGIPTIRSTAPGDEIADMQKLRATQKARAEEEEASVAAILASVSSRPKSVDANGSKTLPEKLRRQFHLITSLADIPTSRKRKVGSDETQSKRFKQLRPPIPTFAEGTPDQAPEVVEVHSQQAKVAVQETHRPVSKSKLLRKTGQSRYDPPDTWDLESDQLADELAEFALSLEPATNHAAEEPVTKPLPSQDVEMSDQNDYVYDTYVRVTKEELAFDPMMIDSDTTIGVLVIDDEVQDLWQEYLNENDEDEDEWDEEDSNAEDNPNYDYPDDEVDSDDEYGNNAYRFRKYGSDDEYYDEQDAA